MATTQAWRRSIAVALPLLAAQAEPATITVTSLADDEIVDGQVTLREAILAANDDSEVDGAVGSGADVIVFGTGPGVITLGGTPLPTITDQLAIRGPGAERVVIDAAHQSRALSVGLHRTLEISRLAIVNGNTGDDGGGIRNGGVLTVRECLIADNVSGSNGGGIAAMQDSTLVVEDSTISRNSAETGGGIWSSGSVELRRSTLARNSATGFGPLSGGGAIKAIWSLVSIDSSTFRENRTRGAWGGAILFQPIPSGATLTLTDSTLAGNQAGNGTGGALSTWNGVTTITGSTVAHNRAGLAGGLHNGGGDHLVLSSSIVAGNEGAVPFSAAGDVIGFVAPTSDHNVIGVGDGVIGISDGVNGNQVGTAPGGRRGAADSISAVSGDRRVAPATRGPTSGSPDPATCGSAFSPVRRGCPRP